MGTKEHITILSAYGRAHWLAKELASLGYKCTVLDFTEKLGNRSPELWEPPFGVLLSERLSSSQKSWLGQTTMTECKKGFTLMLPLGPVELQGPLKTQFFQKLNLHGPIQSFLKDKNKTTIDRAQSSELADFSKSWIVQLAFNIASTRFQHNYKSIENPGNPLPILDSLSLRLMTRRNFEAEQNDLRDRGVHYKTESLLGIQTDKNQVTSLNIGGSTVGSDRYLLFLSTEELLYLNKDVHKKIFSGFVVKPQWFWSKFKILFKPNWVTKVLPKAFVILDPFLPWTHEGLQILHRGSMNDELNIWVRLPYHQRFDTSYLEKIADKLKHTFLARFPQTEVRELVLPMEAGQTNINVGPAPFPVFDEKDLNFPVAQFQNLQWLGPETWYRLDWEYLLNLQADVLNSIQLAERSKETVKRRGRDLEIYS